MSIVGLEPTKFVSEQYCYHALTGEALPVTFKNTPVASSIPG